MGFPSDLDYTQDQLLGSWVFASMTAGTTALGGFPAAPTAVSNIGNSPTDFTVSASVYGVSVATNDYTIISVIGATDAAFTNKYVLGHFVLGDGATIGTTFGDAPTADRGTGHYTIRCTNVVPNGLESSNPIVCPFIRLAAKTVGATSSLNGVFVVSESR